MKKIVWFYLYIAVLVMISLALMYSFMEYSESLELGIDLLFLTPVFFTYVLFIPLYIKNGLGSKLTLFFTDSKLFKRIVLYELLSIILLVAGSILLNKYYFIGILIVIFILSLLQIILNVCIKERVRKNINISLCSFYLFLFMIITYIYSVGFVNNNNYLYVLFNVSSVLMGFTCLFVYIFLMKQKYKLKSLKSYINLEDIKIAKLCISTNSFKIFILSFVLLLIYRTLDYFMISGMLDTDMSMFFLYSFILQLVIIISCFNYFNNYVTKPIFNKIKKIIPLFVIFIFSSYQLVVLLFSEIDQISSILGMDFLVSFSIVCFLLMALSLYKAANYKRLILGLLIVVVIKVLFNAPLIAMFEYSGFSQIVGASITSFIAYIVGFLAMILNNQRDVRKNTQEVLSFIFNMCLLFIALAFIIVVLNSLIFNSFVVDSFTALLSLIILIILSYMVYRVSYKYF